MMDVFIHPSRLSGEVRAVASKSDAHRCLLCAALADHPTAIEMDTMSEDIQATIDCIRSLGAEVEKTGPTTYRVTPIRTDPMRHPILNCGESGTTLRFLLPIATALYGSVTFTGGGRLPERPLSPLLEEMERHGCVFSARQIPLTVNGLLRGGAFTLPGNVSSQFISGLLLAFPLLNEGGSIDLTANLESSGYVDMTIATLRQFGVEVEKHPNRFQISAEQRYKSPGHLAAEGDWSNSAFWLVAGALSGTISCTSLDPNSNQADKQIEAVLRSMGADMKWVGSHLTVHRSSLLGAEIDASNIPDLVPILAVAASVADGTTYIRNAGRLRIKESDRLHAMADCLLRIGGNVREYEDGLEITGVKQLKGGEVDGYHDHRIVMAMAVASTVCESPLLIRGAEAVNKSYPGFFDDWKKLGGTAHVEHHRT